MNKKILRTKIALILIITLLLTSLDFSELFNMTEVSAADIRLPFNPLR